MAKTLKVLGARTVCSSFGNAKGGFTNGLTDEEKNLIIAQALETEEGKIALAQAMIEPIKKTLEYQSIGKKLLMVDDISEAAWDKYTEEFVQTIEGIQKKFPNKDVIDILDTVVIPMKAKEIEKDLLENQLDKLSSQSSHEFIDLEDV